MNDDTKIVYLEVTPATEGYAVAHGALFDKTIGWHYIGDVPLELEEFVIKPVPTRKVVSGKSVLEFIDVDISKTERKTKPSSRPYQGQITDTMIAKIVTQNFSNIEDFNRWLATPKRALNGKKPKEVMLSAEGRKKIYELIRDLYK